MSDETPPPSLRLKPRQRTEGEAPPAPPPSAPAQATPAAAPAETEGGKLRLKPKLAAESATTPTEAVETPPPAPPAPEPPPAAAPAVERIRLKPKLNQESAQQTAPEAQAPATVPAEVPPAPPPPAAEAVPPAPEEGKIKLKFKLPSAGSGGAPSAPASPATPVPPPTPATEAAAAPAAPPPFPVVLAPGTAPGAGAPPPVPRPSGLPRRSPAEMQAAARRTKMIKLVLVGVGSVLLAGAMIGFAIVKFIEPAIPPPSRRAPRPRTAPAAVVQPPPATPAVPVAPVAAAPAETKVSTVEKVEPDVPPPVISRPPAARSKSGSTVTSTVTTDLAPGITATTESVVAAVEASQEFRSFVANAKISGVFQGQPARALINGRLVRAGEVVDSSLGILFESVDHVSKTILFKDSTGAKISKRY